MTRLRAPKALQRLGAHEDGSLTTEFAIALPLFISLVVGILEFANFFFVANALENAVLHASRYGITGNQTSGVSREQTIRSIIRRQAFGQLNEEDLLIETLVYEQFADIDTPEPFDDVNGNGQYDPGEDYTDVNGNGVWDADLGSAGLGNAGDIVLYRVRYDMHSLTGLFDWAARFTDMEAIVAVRNEPY